MSSKIKVYELAKELGQDPQHLVDVVQRLGIDIKNSMSVLGTEEVRNIREYYRKNRPITKSVNATVAKTSTGVTEKRVGSTVIRRRAKAGAEAPPAPVEEQAPIAEGTEEAPQEIEAAPEVFETTASNEAEVETEELAAPVENVAESAAPPVQPPAATEAKTAAPVVEEPKRTPRRFYPSIIKKVSTEQHLVEKVGAKVERPKREEKPKTAATATTGTTATGTGILGLGPKRVKEVELQAPEAAREAGRKKLLEHQSAVFKRTDYLKRELVHATRKKKNVINRPAMKTKITEAAAHKRVVEMGDTISVGDLAKGMGVKAAQVIGKLMALGVTATVNQSIDFDTASLVAPEFKHEIKQTNLREEDYVVPVSTEEGEMKPRGPVVTIMGHVDHGKTSLLDYIRRAKVAAGEAGGITQHVGAYTVELPKGKISFIDTPGHEAFTAMRARGAKVTDIVILVVSAVDGVMPQTLESVSHAQAANVPIIVAVNKTDLPDANPDRVKQTLAGHGLNPEEWGGDTIYVNVSAKTGKGVDQLLESVLLQAELLELKANWDVPARAAVIESKLDKARGPVATILVQHGQLKPGDVVVCGTVVGKVRALTDTFGKRVKEASPGDPVEILGLPAVPTVGDELQVVADEKAAKLVVDSRLARIRDKQEGRKAATLEELMAAPSGEKELRIVLKADVQGSTEALKDAILKFPTDKAKVKVLHVGTGGITESDVMLASASQGVIIGFNIRPDVKAQKLAEAEGVSIHTYSIIYDLLDDLKKMLEGLLDKKIREKVIGRAEVRDIFSVPKVGTVAGSAVIDGKVQRGCFLRLLRDSRVIYEGKIASLRRFKEDVKEVSSGFECGISVENFNDIKQGDQFEAFLKEEVASTL